MIFEKFDMTETIAYKRIKQSEPDCGETRVVQAVHEGETCR